MDIERSRMEIGVLKWVKQWNQNALHQLKNMKISI